MKSRVVSRHYWRVITGIVVAVTAVSLVATMITMAPVASAQDAGQGIQVSPTTVDLNGEKGGNYNLRLTVTNVTAGDLVLKSAVNDFTAKDETGTPQVILDNNAAPTAYSIRSWIGTIPSLTLKSKESRSLTVAVHIPSNAEAGGHYGVIRFSGVSPGQSSDAVSLTASVGVLLLARVQGAITENLALKEIYIQKDGQRAGLVANGPVDIIARLSNTGNVHVKPVGTLTVKDSFGKVVGSFAFGSTSKNVLPQSTRLYSQTFNKRFLFGHYTASLQAAYGTTGGVLMGSTSFWVIPYKLIAILLVLLVLLVLGGRRLIHHYNRRVIRKHQQPRQKK